MTQPIRMLFIILIPITVFGTIAVIAGVRCNRRSAGNRIVNGDGMNGFISSEKSGLPYIPEGAVLNSLNWGQSSSNEYECFVFDLNRDANSCKLSGRFTDPEGDGGTELEEVLLSDEQLKSVERILKSGKFRCYTERIPEDTVYDEASSLLCTGWRLSDGSVITVKYNGMAAKELFEVLKLLLRQ